MRVAILHYPMLFQRTGGLQVQVLGTLHALRDRGVDARIFDYAADRLADFDVAHVFSAINGTHRIVEQAERDGVPVVLSTVLHPPWTRLQELRARLASWCAGQVSGGTLSTTHAQIRICLERAQAVIALGERERAMLESGYGVRSDKLHVVPNGIKSAFFSAGADLFRERFGIDGPYALNVASVNDYKNQRTALEALKGIIPLVVIGPCSAQNRDYLERLEESGGSWFRYLGPLDNEDPALPSAYAGASLFVLPSRTEVQPISALEALAADCPVIITANHSLDIIEGTELLTEVSPTDSKALAAAARSVLGRSREPGAIRSRVEHLTWDAVAEQLSSVYSVVASGAAT